MFRYQPGFLLEVAPVNIKHDAKVTLSNEAAAKLRRLPLEIAAQAAGKALHKKWALTMSHYNAPDSAVSSFGILLADAPHLDHQFTVFGYLVPDKDTVATVNKIVSHWSSQAPAYIVSASEDASSSQKALAAAASPAHQTGTIHVCNDLYCGIKSTPAPAPAPAPAPKAKDNSGAENYPAFSVSTDGPLLSSAKNMIMKTSAGNIHLLLEPALAPKNASQMYRLFKQGVFDGTPMARYEPNFVLQTAVAETKTGGKSISAQAKAILRRLPLETAAQTNDKGEHKKLALTMAHGDEDANSAVSSFSILLGDAPHLDHKYTVFGHVLGDQETTATLQKIAQQWAKSQPTILSVEDRHYIAASR
jgi:cyclophilin family peptidyl-prolyl cis-trans isomerase